MYSTQQTQPRGSDYHVCSNDVQAPKERYEHNLQDTFTDPLCWTCFQAGYLKVNYSYVMHITCIHHCISHALILCFAAQYYRCLLIYTSLDYLCPTCPPFDCLKSLRRIMMSKCMSGKIFVSSSGEYSGNKQYAIINVHCCTNQSLFSL